METGDERMNPGEIAAAAGVSLSDMHERVCVTFVSPCFSLLTPNEANHVAVHSSEEASRWHPRVAIANGSKATVQVEMEQASSSIVTSTFIVPLESETTRLSAMQCGYIEPCSTNHDM